MQLPRAEAQWERKALTAMPRNPRSLPASKRPSMESVSCLRAPWLTVTPTPMRSYVLKDTSVQQAIRPCLRFSVGISHSRLVVQSTCARLLLAMLPVHASGDHHGGAEHVHDAVEVPAEVASEKVQILAPTTLPSASCPSSAPSRAQRSLDSIDR
ncbi:hypothetical protein IE81DRAFT_180868 [Ceraceosorus guamensis]|uniref:Uncharacterized protein n=1 Tax=Ceraceosorus guamensis TaxID=1522189 RepID=A0A316VV27_9BASI|nr:hypothetical protein IE81DRAFT_180868 [Ceraceosorus guamensis]PWN41320.1 hypothetical protein IE81DRAFT_180868 [Ceraceosorus guamensis]